MEKLVKYRERKTPIKMMGSQKFLAFFLTLYAPKTNCDMLNLAAEY